MKPFRNPTVCSGLSLVAAALLCAALAPRAAAQISLASTVNLALQNSTKVRLAQTDIARAQAGLAEAKDVYIPNIVAGAGLGPPSIGFPLGQPSVFNVQAGSLVFSFSQPDYIRSAHAALKAARLNLKDTQDQVTLDCALAYVQLEADTREIASLSNEKDAAERLVAIEEDRMAAGVDSRMDVTRAEITSAQVDLKKLHAEDDATAQREKLAHLTGMPAASFIPEAQSIPPVSNSLTGGVDDQSATANAGVRAAYANAKSKLELSFGDARQSYRPQFVLGAQYSRFANFENYSEYYQHFTPNNFGIGVQITLPIFDFSRRAKARESAAEAAHARIQAEQAKNQVSEQVSLISHSLDELKAQRHLAQLQSDLAQQQLAAVESEMKSGTGSPNAAPVTPKDEQLARINADEQYQSAVNANLTLLRAQLSLMRATGTIESWANTAIK